ncbi:hypothetical protein [Natronocalculus amylovorans]|uniref:Uncharacterized protein n=1 Tax=Natronocalculus amylovorans TaxID=2917812 RepID=A0AAE3FVV7_9EURY|nr:hypothetical protein [Natronocalculus amylovorans]MCL9816547.1 hypothetical protein [Natronocalculus amylovorans]NUE00992.1 hypothetical protein [Halorubraceae archaeon YAN]
MRIKLTRLPPAPETVDTVWDVHRAVPLVPATEVECKRRIQRRCTITDPQTAHDWITLLRALSLVTNTTQGYVRIADRPPLDEIRIRFVSAVLGAQEVLALAFDDEKAQTGESLLEVTKSLAPPWEQLRDPQWESAWEQGHARLVEWLALLGLLKQTTTGYQQQNPLSRYQR